MAQTIPVVPRNARVGETAKSGQTVIGFRFVVVDEKLETRPEVRVREAKVFNVGRALAKLFSTGSSKQRILRDYRQQQQKLQSQFFVVASTQGKPRGLRWTQCDWLESYTMVLDPETNLVTMFQGVNLSFEAIEGGDMEDVAAVSMVRDATAVFHYRECRWGTGGRVLFNMTPQMAAQIATPDQTVVFTQQ